MKKQFNLGEIFQTAMELSFNECTIPSGTDFEINEILSDGEYKIHFSKCIYDNNFKKECKRVNCEINNEDGIIQVCSYDEVVEFKK